MTVDRNHERRALGVVGIGASAGGLESLERFFDSVTQPVGVPFVVVQHLSPNYDTMMDQLLARRTSMPVSIATDGQTIEGNHVYVIPPKKNLILKDERLILEEQDRNEIPHLTIDRFFKSMASECGRRCAAIVLSGTGSDGSAGIRAVSASGGLVLAEAETTAKFSGMPRSAQLTGCVEYALPPESMIGPIAVHFGLQSNDTDEQRHAGNELAAIFELLKRECKIDFKSYKKSTVSRRIDRRMSLAGVGKLADYTDILRKDPVELKSLYQDMLIGVTKFFRDPPCFEYLSQEVLPRIFRDADADTGIRGWVCGCATGEEAYSLAILMEETRQKLGSDIDYKIFASDLHPDSLIAAAHGVYSTETLSNVSTARLERFFTPTDEGYRITNDIRGHVVFTPHNVLEDPPFTSLDIVTCRNLLIYFDPESQRRALTMFHFGLKKDGVLFLGPSETIGRLSHEFPTLSDKIKVYRKRSEVRLPNDVRVPLSTTARKPITPLPQVKRKLSDEERMRRYDRLLDNLLPPTMLVDDRRTVIETFGGAEKFLRLPHRVVSSDLLDLCPKEIQTPLSALFRRVQVSRASVRLPLTNVSLNEEDSCDLVLSISPIDPGADATPLYAIQILINDGRQRRGDDSREDAETVNLVGGQRDNLARIDALELELAHSRENLQATIEELETSNEELQTTNEELISSNEELQSTNEELNSVNEEMHTVNVEYQNKNAELKQLNDDMLHLFRSTDVGTIFLDETLSVRRFTPRMGSMFNLEEHDIGRKLAAFSHSLDVDDLHQLTVQVLNDGEVIEREVGDAEGNHFFLRVLPYVREEAICGVILTLTDISPVVEGRKALRRAQRRLQEAIDAVPVFVSFVNRDMCYEYMNKAYRNLIGFPGEITSNVPVHEVLGREAFERSRPFIERALRGEPQSFTTAIDSVEGTIHVAVDYVPTRDRHGRVKGFYVAATDITKMREVELELEMAVQNAQEANRAKSDFLAKMSHEIRSPMTAILGFADILEEQLKIADNRNCVQIIRKNGNHLLDLINDMLDLSRIESGHFEFDEEAIDLVTLLRECHNTVITKAQKNDVSLRLDVSDTITQPVLSDRRRLKQVVLNLLTNAVKFTNTGDVRMSVRRMKRRNAFAITIADQGCGIPASELPSLFEPFCQADNSDVRKFEGTGLGLTIAKQLVDQLGGRLSVRSRVDEGTVFRAVLPWREAKSTPEIDRIKLSQKLPSLTGKTLLVIDDRRDIRFIVEHILRDVGADVVTAEDGASGIRASNNRRAEDKEFDCIVTDIQMPEMDGYETAVHLRAHGYSGPILALSASAMEEDRDRAVAAGCNDHCPKPIDKRKLIAKIAELVSRGPSDGET